MMKCARLNTLLGGAALAVFLAAGCTHRDAPPNTPSIAYGEQTPTNRSTTNSWEANNSPKFTQPGINGGQQTTLPAIARHDRYDQNSPLALTVYGAIQNDSQINSRYIVADADGSVVRLSGTASAADSASALKIAQTQPGVTKVIDKIKAD